MNFFDKRSIIITVICLFLIIGLGTLNYVGIELSFLQWLQKGIFNLTSPLLEYFTYGYNSVRSYSHGILNTGEILDENARLKKEVARLEKKINELETSIRQNQRLEQMEAFLEAFKSFSDYNVLGASVIGYGPSNWENKIIINQGTKNGLKKGMPVISYNGILVGKISQVGSSNSQVMLINNTDFAVGAIVQRSRDIGLIKGQINNVNINIMDKLSADADIQEGDHILTSGLSNNYPKYLPIGEVVKVESDNYGISQKAEVKLFLSQYTLEEVLVITDFSEGEETGE